MKLLGVESSQAQCSLSLLLADKCFNEINANERQHSDHLLSMLDSLLNKANINIQQLDMLAFSAGPGSFTGLRLGAALVQALAYAHDLTCVPVSSLELLAVSGLKQYPDVERVVCCIDARVNGIYWASFNVDKNNPDILTALERQDVDALSHAPYVEIQHVLQFEDTLFVGDGVNVLLGSNVPEAPDENNNVYATNVMPIAEDLVCLAQNRTQYAVSAQDVMPVYLRGADAWKKQATK